MQIFAIMIIERHSVHLSNDDIEDGDDKVCWNVNVIFSHLNKFRAMSERIAVHLHRIEWNRIAFNQILELLGKEATHQQPSNTMVPSRPSYPRYFHFISFNNNFKSYTNLVTFIWINFELKKQSSCGKLTAIVEHFCHFWIF